jgi:hypothetical protein
MLLEAMLGFNQMAKELISFGEEAGFPSGKRVLSKERRGLIRLQMDRVYPWVKSAPK